MPFDKVHHEISDLMLSDERFIGVLAPRKIGKTPLICFSYPLRQILYNLETYIVIISATKDEESARHVNKITTTIESSEIIHYYYGKLVVRRGLETQKGSVQFANRIWLRAKGVYSQIRGTGGDWSPPSLIIVDDPQSDKDVRTEKSVVEAWNWFQDEVIYSVAQKWKHPYYNVIKPGKIRFLGTSLHPLCLAEKVYKDKRFKALRYAMLVDEEGNPCLEKGRARSIWEDMFPTEYLLEEMAAADAENTLANWLQERMNMPRQYGDRFFDIDNIGNWDVGTNRFDIVMGQPVLVLDEDLGLQGGQYAN